QTIAILLDLSGDKKAARDWASTLFPRSEIKEIDKVTLKWSSRLEAVASIRELKASEFVVFASDLDNQASQRALMIFGALAGARRIVLADSRGRSLSRSRLGVLLIETTRFVIEITVGYAIVLPLSWLITEALRLSLLLRPVVRASLPRRCAPNV